MRRSTVKRQLSHSYRSVLSRPCLPSGQSSSFFFHTWPTLGPSPGGHTHPSAKMGLKVKSSGRSKIHYGLALSPHFWLTGSLSVQVQCLLCPKKEGSGDPLILSNRFLALFVLSMTIALRCFSSVQSLSRVGLFAIPWIAACQASLSITNSWSLLMSIESVMPSSHLILCHPILLLPPIPPSIRVFSNESTLRMRWPKCWSFSFSISPSNEHPGLSSFRMDWLDPLAVQGTLKSLLQHHSSKASILRHSAFFTVWLLHPYMTMEKP